MVAAPPVVHARVAHQPRAAVQVDVDREVPASRAVEVDRHPAVPGGDGRALGSWQVAAGEPEPLAVGHGEPRVVARRASTRRRSASRTTVFAADAGRGWVSRGRA